MTTHPSSTPAAGVYPETPYEQYHRWDAASNSRLTRIRQSPAHLRAYLDGGDRETPALLLGRAIHTAVLEPDTFDARYVVAEQCTADKKDGSRCSNPGITLHSSLGWFCGVHVKGAPISLVSTKIVLADSDFLTCRAVRDSVYRHPAARALLAGITPQTAELSLVWNDPDTGILCKARPDYFSEALAGGAIVDLKSARDASEREFERAIFAMGYHRQGALYLDGAEESKLDVGHFAHIAVEKEAPYAVAVYRLRDDVVVAGRQQLQPMKARYAECLASGLWPAYSDEVRDIGLPAWAWAQIDEEVIRV